MSKCIRLIGGTGTIHGCIVDIDYNNHIYVNPKDQTITPYFAYDMVDKTVYPNVSMLLEEKCKELYNNFKSLYSTENTESNELLIMNEFFLKNCGVSTPIKYESTDIYSASRQIKGLQRLYSNVLIEWYEPEKIMRSESFDEGKDVIKLMNERFSLLSNTAGIED